MPKQHFVKTVFSFIIEVLEGLSNKLPFSFIFFRFLFSLAKHPLRMISQRMSS